jgi:hypothetical protein
MRVCIKSASSVDNKCTCGTEMTIASDKDWISKTEMDLKFTLIVFQYLEKEKNGEGASLKENFQNVSFQISAFSHFLRPLEVFVFIFKSKNLLFHVCIEDGLE